MLPFSVLFLIASIFATKAFMIRRHNDTFFLLSRGVAKEIEDVDTISAFGFEANSVDNVTTEMLDQFVRGPPIPLIKKMDNSPDECMRVELLKIHALQNVVMDDFTIICKRIFYFLKK